VILALPLLNLATPAVGQEFRVLLVGDSWAELMWFNQSLRTVFAEEGHPEILEKGDVTALGGTTAAEWTTPSFLQLITDELDANPTLEVVQLTLGGNDFLAGQPGGGWYQGMPDAGIDPGDLPPPGDVTLPSPPEAMFLGADCFHLNTEGYEHLARNLWDGYYASRFTGAIFTDGFESSDTSAWTLVVP
jgi:hypothetical protein